MLSNAYFLVKFRFDTAENEPAKNLQNFAKKIVNFADPNLRLPVRRREQHLGHGGHPRRELADAARGHQLLNAHATAALRDGGPGGIFSLPPSPGEGPLTATKTSAPRRGRTTGRRWVSGRVFSRHPLKFIEICKFNGFP